MQYKVLYRILGTNDLLFKINRHDDGKCSFCKEYNETILHLFVQCKNVQNFWSELKTNMQLILGIDLAIDPSTIILGNLLTKVNAIPLNTVYLAAKLYIFQKSKLNQIPNYLNFCNFFKKNILNRFQIIRTFVTSLKIYILKTINFTKIWGNFTQIFTAWLYEILYNILMLFFVFDNHLFL